MPNSPAADTATISLTMPHQLLKAIDAKARASMTNRSDVVRQALMNYLSPQEREQVRVAMAESDRRRNNSSARHSDRYVMNDDAPSSIVDVAASKLLKKAAASVLKHVPK